MLDYQPIMPEPYTWKGTITPSVIDYEILLECTAIQLEARVKDAISAGWQPLGGVSVAVYERGEFGKIITWYSQAIVKYK